MKLAIGGSSVMYHVTLYDDGASSCGTDANGDWPAAIARGEGSASGDKLSVVFSVTCLFHPPSSNGTAPYSFTYDAPTDTLLDSHGVTWTRM